MRFGSPDGDDQVYNVEPESDGLAEAVATSTVGHGFENDKPFSAYASEYANVVLNLLPGDTLPKQAGKVQQLRQHVETPDSQQTDPASDNRSEHGASSSGRDGLDITAAVTAEAARVKAKFASIDTSTEVTLRFDFISDTDTRGTSSERFQHSASTMWSICIGAVCFSLMSALLVVFSWRVLQARMQNKTWKVRRKRNAILFFVEAAVQWVNLLFYVVPNAFLLKHPCSFLGPVVFWCGWVRWTCWNTLFTLFFIHSYGARTWKKPKTAGSRLLSPAEAAFQPPEGKNKLYMDGPWRLLWPCLLMWALLEAALSVAWLRNAVGSRGTGVADVAPRCQTGFVLPLCTADPVTKIFIYIMVALGLAYFLTTAFVLLFKLQQFKRMPYASVQVGMVFYRLQLRLRAIVMAFLGLSMILLWVVNINSCASFQFSWLGLTPMQVVMTANAFVFAYIAMPHNPQEHAVAMRVWEQEFAWTEADKPIKLAARALTVPGDHELNKQPIFCFETMMHMLYWSCLVYDHKRAVAATPRKPSKRRLSPNLKPSPADTSQQYQPQRTTLKLHTALGLYGLTDSELFWELQLDTRCLMGWSNDTIVVAFRGTASMTNAWSDLQAWRVVHPPKRGHAFCTTRPLVHGGFMKSWLAGGFNTKVLNRIMDLVNGCKAGGNKLKIYITGHSMGGALATLAAYDVRKQLTDAGKADVEVVCYSFGAPRTGNHAFARDYNRMVPDTWSIINDQDIVTRSAKFVFLYKRPGKRVIVNDLGRLIVSPTSMEANIQRSTAGQSVDHHFLTSYHHTILSIILAQFSPTGFADGMEGMLKLVAASPYLKGLLDTHMNMPLDAMQQFAQLSSAERGNQVMPGARLPAKGFYRIKTITPSQLQKPQKRGSILCGMPFWCCDHSPQELDAAAKGVETKSSLTSEISIEKAASTDSMQLDGQGIAADTEPATALAGMHV